MAPGPQIWPSTGFWYDMTVSTDLPSILDVQVLLHVVGGETGAHPSVYAGVVIKYTRTSDAKVYRGAV
jgi:hypothetical protein